MSKTPRSIASQLTTSITRPIVTIREQIGPHITLELDISETAIIRYLDPDDDAPATDRHIISASGTLRASVDKGRGFGNDRIEAVACFLGDRWMKYLSFQPGIAGSTLETVTTINDMVHHQSVQIGNYSRKVTNTTFIVDRYAFGENSKPDASSPTLIATTVEFEASIYTNKAPIIDTSALDGTDTIHSPKLLQKWFPQ